MYRKIIEQKYKETINNFKSNNKNNYYFLLDYLNNLFNKSINPNEVVNSIINDYLKSVEAISKLSPGLSTSLFDIKNNINISTYTGNVSDVDCKRIDENTVFDLSSITKLYTAIFLLHEEEHGNIDLSNLYSYYTNNLPFVNVKIIDSLKFGHEIITNGRIDNNELSAIQRVDSLISSEVYKYNTFKYSDIPYMLIPLLYSNSVSESSEIYKGKIDDFLYENGLINTGYNYDNMTGGYNSEVFDPKAKVLLNDGIIVPAHAGITSNVEDIKKLFVLLYNGLLSNESLKKLVTPVNPQKKSLVDGNKNIVKNRGMGVYININDNYLSDLSPRYSENAFCSAGSTGTFSVFDLDNGINVSILSNIKSTNKSKIINTGDYIYGTIDNSIPKNTEVKVLGGLNSKLDGSIETDDGIKMSYVSSTTYFKEECLNTLLKLRIAKQVLNCIYSNENFNNIFSKVINTNKEKQLILK